MTTFDLVDGQDVRDAAAVARAFRNSKPEVVHHLAASLEVSNGLKNPAEEAQTNIVGTINIVEACRRSGARLFYASSGAVYGRQEKQPLKEDSPLEPHWPYGVSKLAGEKYVEQARLLHGLKTTSFRYSIVYGVGEWFGRAHTMFIRSALKGKPIVVFGDGEQTRDYIHVSDIVDAHMLALEAGATGVYNLGSGTGTSIIDIAETVRGMAGSRSEIITVDVGEGERFDGRVRLNGEIRRFCLDSSKARHDFWGRRATSLYGLKEEIEWAKGRWRGRPRA